MERLKSGANTIELSRTIEGAPRFSLYFFVPFAPFRGYSFSLVQVLADGSSHFGGAN
jgi:hypothetical protein